ncbi:sensor domain-containing diguanylate cyclase [Roseburia intestinalis]|uniref:Diguanylate cyclase (GGDEF) domain protein n=2 Tax=Roseburia intestinalis L1-82 TaxID=536231 RepID=C7G618_9FIRM|nr:diguanylate cyclase [Roseburia intestinalis]EEV02755.1 diguanylate cyclase (GGDEF) domain protein [Roseburia intestinalis L1-82]
MEEAASMKLKHSILGLLLLFTLIPLGIFGIFSIYETNRKIDELTEQNVRAISENQVMNIKNFTQDRNNEMDMIASYQLTQNAILYSLRENESPLARNYVDNLLKERKKYSIFVASISVVNRNFHVVSSSEEYESGTVSAMKDVDPKYQTGEFIIGDVYERITDDGRKNVVPAYTGVYYNNELIGYVMEELDTAYFDDLRLNMDTLADGTFYLLDGNGAIITAGDTKNKRSLKTFVSKSSDRNDFQKKWDAIDHEKNPSGYVRYRYHRQDYITYYSDVENTGWGIRVTENLSAQKQTGRTYGVLIALGLSALIIGVFCTQYFMTKKIFAPITHILQVFAQIRESEDYSLRVHIQEKHETGELAAGINELLDYVEQADRKEKERQQKLLQMAENDPLTGIKNKKAIEKEMLSMVQRAVESHEQITFGFVDIDDFRDYNTNYGHQEGDAVIQFVAQTLKENIHGAVGRIGGDEFAFCYAGELEPERIRHNADKILEILRTQHVNEQTGEVLPVPCSIGIVMSQGDTLDYTQLIRKADLAMYQAKENGKNTFVLNVD